MIVCYRSAIRADRRSDFFKRRFTMKLKGTKTHDNL